MLGNLHFSLKGERDLIKTIVQPIYFILFTSQLLMQNILDRQNSFTSDRGYVLEGFGS